jgi:hypothetical protein
MTTEYEKQQKEAEQAEKVQELAASWKGQGEETSYSITEGEVIPDEEYQPDYAWEDFSSSRCADDDKLTELFVEAHGFDYAQNRRLNVARTEDVYALDMNEPGKWTGECSTPMVYELDNTPKLLALVCERGLEEARACVHDDSGELTGVYIRRNGTHRARAVQASTTGVFWSLVLYNPRAGAVDNLDGGLARSKTNLLELTGIPPTHSKVLAQTIGYMHQLERNKVNKAYKGERRFISTVRPYSHQEMLDLLRDSRTVLGEAAAEGIVLAGGNKLTGGNSLSPAVFAYLLIALREDEDVVNGRTALAFLREVAGQSVADDGTDPYRVGRPAAILRQKIGKERDAQKGKNNGFSAPDQMKLVFGTWSRFLAGETVDRIVKYEPPKRQTTAKTVKAAKERKVLPFYRGAAQH